GAAIEARDRMLAGAVAGARQTARNALARVADAAPGRAASLDDLLSGSAIEQGLVVLGGDTVVAMAGPQRVAPITAGTEAALLTSPFVRVLIVSASRGERTAQVALPLDGSPALPGSGGALADRAGNWQRV